MKLKQILLEMQQEESFGQPTTLTKEEKQALMEKVGQYNEYSKVLCKNESIMEAVKNIQHIVHLAERYMLSECGDYVEANTAKRRIKEIRKYCDELAKIAPEVESKLNQAAALYEDIGERLNKYFEIHDVNPSSQTIAEPAALIDPRTVNVAKTQEIAEVKDAKIVNPSVIGLIKK